jgi:pilus assembly protein CpaB
VKITPGKRAIAVRIDDVAGLNGLIQPNSRVDVLVTLRDNERNAGQQVAKLFMSNMRVLSVGTISQTSNDNRPISAPTATLEVTPVEAERLAIAQREGTIQLVLRGYGDPDSIKTEGAKSADVLAQLRSAPTAKTPDPAPRRNPVRTATANPQTVTAPAPPPVTAPAPAPVVTQPATPAKPDSVAVQIFKGDKQESRKFQKPDSSKIKPVTP